MTLLPDFDGDLEQVLGTVERVLVELASLNVTGIGDNQRDSEWRAALLGTEDQPRLAVARMIAAVLTGRGQRGRQFTHDGSYQHRPLCVVTLRNADLGHLRTAISTLNREVAAGNEIVKSMVRRHHLSLERAAQILGLFSLVPTDEAVALIAAIGDGQVDVTFTEALDDAYRVMIARIQAVWNADPCIYDLL